MKQNNNKSPSLLGHICVFALMILIVSFATIFMNVYLIVGFCFLLVIFFAMGYGTSAIIGLICGIIVWFYNDIVGIANLLNGFKGINLPW